MDESTQDYSQKSNEDLMIAYQEGDSGAFNELYDRIADKLYGYLERRVPTKDMVDDIFQNILAKFHQSRSQYRPSLPVMPWLFTICRTVMIDSLRHHARQRETYDEDMDKYQNFEVSSVTDQSSNLEKELPSAVTGLRILSSPQKEALTLRFEDDLSFEDIAKKLETTPANVRQIISRAVKKLRTFTKKKQVFHE